MPLHYLDKIGPKTLRGGPTERTKISLRIIHSISSLQKIENRTYVENEIRTQTDVTINDYRGLLFMFILLL